MMPTDAALQGLWVAVLTVFAKAMLVVTAVLAVLVVLAACFTMGDKD
jgi:hypothetical protein